jgi:hypothetical protein
VLGKNGYGPVISHRLHHRDLGIVLSVWNHRNLDTLDSNPEPHLLQDLEITRRLGEYVDGIN